MNFIKCIQKVSEMSVPQCNVLLIGDANTGKTSIARVYADGSFAENYNTTLCPTSQTKSFLTPSGAFQLIIYDTAGTEGWKSLNASLYNKTHAIIFVVSMDSIESLDNIIDVWKPEIGSYIDESNYKAFIAVNKIDLPKEEQLLTENVIKEKALLINAKVFMVSAKESIMIKEMFLELAAILNNSPLEAVREGDPKTEESDVVCNCGLI